jgi:hypothetical protein
MPRFHMAWCVLTTALSAVTVLQSSARGQQKDEAVTIVSEQALDHWRASKLIGIRVVDLQGESIGSISEVLVDHAGVAQVAVTNVGGVFGIGRKAVGVSFAALKWISHEDTAPKTYNAPPNKPSLGAFPKRPDTKNDASSGYPDHAILRLTRAQLKDAPDFRYARPIVFTTKSPAGSGGPLNTPGGPAAPE